MAALLTCWSLKHVNIYIHIFNPIDEIYWAIHIFTNVLSLAKFILFQLKLSKYLLEVIILTSKICTLLYGKQYGGS